MANGSKRAWVVLAGLLLVGAGIAFLPRTPAPVATVDAPAPALRQDPPGDAPTPSPVGLSSRPGPPEPLPALGAPLADVLPELRRRAAAGEPGAACRLAADLDSCRWLRARREDHARWLAERRQALELQGVGGSAESIAEFTRTFDQQVEQREAGLRGHEARCAGVPAPTEAELVRHWAQAARLGSHVAMRHYASGQAFQWSGILDGANELSAFRSEAPAMARALAEAGDLPMTIHLAGALAPLSSRTRTLLGQAVAEDPVMSLALYRRALDALVGLDSGTARRLADQVRQRIDLVEQFMTPDQRADAGRRQAELAQWRPLRPDSLHPATSVDGMRVPANVMHCHAEAGEPEPPGLQRIRIE